MSTVCQVSNKLILINALQHNDVLFHIGERFSSISITENRILQHLLMLNVYNL